MNRSAGGVSIPWVSISHMRVEKAIVARKKCACHSRQSSRFRVSHTKARLAEGARMSISLPPGLPLA